MKKVLIVGMGESGRSVYVSCIQNGDLPFFYDDNFLKVDVNKMLKIIDFAVLSPAIKLSSPIVKLLKANNIPILPEIEYAFNNIKNIKNKTLIGITGTNGKTTVTTMIQHVLGDDYCSLCGNVGIPITNCINDIKKYMAIELSSFQLASIKDFKVNIACILNLEPDHLEYHNNLTEYYNSKLNITKNLGENDFLVVYNGNSEITSRIRNNNTNIFYFSKNNTLKGCFIKNGTIFFNDGEKVSEVIKVNEDEIFEHNILNIMAVCTILKICNIDNRIIEDRLKTYKYMPYRLEFVRSYNGVKIYNDSKSTNVASLKSALKCFSQKQIILIIGGRYKNESFTEVFSEMKNVKCVYIYGESKCEIIKHAKAVRFSKYVSCKNLEEAVDLAMSNLQDVDVLLFSPACASFDMYTGYEERGKHFSELINNYN